MPHRPSYNRHRRLKSSTGRYRDRSDRLPPKYRDRRKPSHSRSSTPLRERYRNRLASSRHSGAGRSRSSHSPIMKELTNSPSSDSKYDRIDQRHTSTRIKNCKHQKTDDIQLGGEYICLSECKSEQDIIRDNYCKNVKKGKKIRRNSLKENFEQDTISNNKDDTSGDMDSDISESINRSDSITDHEMEASLTGRGKRKRTRTESHSESSDEEINDKRMKFTSERSDSSVTNSPDVEDSRKFKRSRVDVSS